MSRWRIAVLTVLFLLPVAFLVGAGSYHLWQTGWAFYAWWPMAACLTAAYLLAWYWHRQRRLLPNLHTDTAAPHWTERDRQAWSLVEARATAAGPLSVDRLGEPDLYWQT